MHCYLFDIHGSLLHSFPRDITCPDDPVPTDIASATQLRKTQKEFLECLTACDAERFAEFCYAPQSSVGSDLFSDAVPGMLFFPRKRFTACFAGRYTSQMLAKTDPLPGEAAYTLGQETMHQLRSLFRNHHLIPTLALQSMHELYHVHSPLLALVPPAARELLTTLEKNEEPLYRPCLQSYYKEMYLTDIPAMLNLPVLLTKLAESTTGSPLFTGLSLALCLPDAALPSELFWVRCPISAFVHIFLLLSYAAASLSGESQALVSLSPADEGIDLRFRGAAPRLPHTGTDQQTDIWEENQLYSLRRCVPSYAGLLTLAQYFLHRHQIPFTCALGSDVHGSSLTITLTMKTATQDTLAFHTGDTASLLSAALPDGFSLLEQLLP